VIYTHVATGLVGAAVAAVLTWHVQAWRYDTRIAEREQQVAQAAQAAEAAARRREQEMQRYADAIARDAAKRHQVLAARAAATDRMAGELRDDIDRLNAGRRPEDPAAARFADDARAARELLGACVDRYRVVAVSADGLRDQVTGLQDYVRSVSDR